MDLSHRFGMRIAYEIPEGIRSDSPTHPKQVVHEQVLRHI